MRFAYLAAAAALWAAAPAAAKIITVDFTQATGGGRFYDVDQLRFRYEGAGGFNGEPLLLGTLALDNNRASPFFLPKFGDLRILSIEVDSVSGDPTPIYFLNGEVTTDGIPGFEVINLNLDFVERSLFGAGFRGQTLIKSITIEAIPEPATWAMMIGGFGLAGTALRRRASPVPVTSPA